MDEFDAAMEQQEIIRKAQERFDWYLLGVIATAVLIAAVVVSGVW